MSLNFQANTSTAVLQNANGIFASKRLKLNPKYESIVKQDYQSEVTAVDFTDPAAAAFIINSWVSERTHGLIPFVVEPGRSFFFIISIRNILNTPQQTSVGGVALSPNGKSKKSSWPENKFQFFYYRS